MFVSIRWVVREVCGGFRIYKKSERNQGSSRDGRLVSVVQSVSIGPRLPNGQRIVVAQLPDGWGDRDRLAILLVLRARRDYLVSSFGRTQRGPGI